MVDSLFYQRIEDDSGFFEAAIARRIILHDTTTLLCKASRSIIGEDDELKALLPSLILLGCIFFSRECFHSFSAAQ